MGVHVKRVRAQGVGWLEDRVDRLIRQLPPRLPG